MKKIAIILGLFSVVGFNSCKKCAECHAAAEINGTEYELMELGEYCKDDLTSIEADGYPITETLYLTADGDSLPTPFTGVAEVHCGEDH